MEKLIGKYNLQNTFVTKSLVLLLAMNFAPTFSANANRGEYGVNNTTIARNKFIINK